MDMRNIGRAMAILVSSAALAGCGGFFDDLAAYQAPIEPHQAPQDTDYVAACHQYGCPSTPAQPTTPSRPSGCAYSLPDGSSSPGGTACPQ